MQRSAIFSKCRKYRYSLHRAWNDQLPGVLYIGLNPSAADEQKDDPTIRRCIQFAKSWGYGRMSIVNLFAFRHHDPKFLLKARSPIGKRNDFYIRKMLKTHQDVVLIWGNHGSFLDRSAKVLAWIENPLCIKINKSGQPAHPLYLKKKMQPVPFEV